MPTLIDESVTYRPMRVMQSDHKANRPKLPVEPDVLERTEHMATIENNGADPMVATVRLTFKGVGLWMSDYARSYTNIRYYWKRKKYIGAPPPELTEVRRMHTVLTQRAYAVPHAATRHLVTVPGMTMTKSINLRAGQKAAIFAGMSAELDASAGRPPNDPERHTLRHWHGIELHIQLSRLP